MAVGQQASQSQLNGQLTQLCLALRSDCANIRNLNEFVATLGANGLEALGFSTGDATAFINACAVINTVAALYFGTATQATEFNFDNALSGFWAGS